MEQKVIDLYEAFGQNRPDGAAGYLTAWLHKPVPQICKTRRYPAILILPGGGYTCVSPRESEPVASRFFALGYSTFVLDYSVEPLAFPVALREAAMAMAYIRQNAQALSVRADNVAAIGFSAGGHLCGLLGTMYDCPDLADLARPEQIRPDVLGLCYPVVTSWGKCHADSFRRISGGNKQLTAYLSLEKRVRSDMPPVFLWHTRDDASVSVRNSLELACALEEAEVLFTMHIYGHGKHGLSTADENAFPIGKVPEVSQDVTGWFESCIGYFKECGFSPRDE